MKYKTWPTLDMSRDIVANNDREATEICRKETEKIILEACNKLFDLGYSEVPSDERYIFITAEWPEEGKSDG